MAVMTIRQMRWLIPAGIIATWPAWYHFFKFGWHSFEIGLILFTGLTGYYLYLQRNVCGGEPADTRYGRLGWTILIIYIASYHFLPSLGNVILAVELLACLMLASFPRDYARKPIAFLILFPLTLPLETALQFIVGYPFRKITAQLASLGLAIYGTDVKGTTLYYGTRALEVDAACSGVIGLWNFMLAGAILSLICNFGYKKMAITTLMTVAAGLLYNVVRTSLLFMSRFHFGPESETMHSIIGAVAFILILIALLYLSSRKYKWPRSAWMRRA